MYVRIEKILHALLTFRHRATNVDDSVIFVGHRLRPHVARTAEARRGDVWNTKEKERKKSSSSRGIVHCSPRQRVSLCPPLQTPGSRQVRRVGPYNSVQKSNRRPDERLFKTSFQECNKGGIANYLACANLSQKEGHAVKSVSLLFVCTFSPAVEIRAGS